MISTLFCQFFQQSSADGKTNFLKISAPDDLLERYAKFLNLQIPTKVKMCSLVLVIGGLVL